MIERTEFFDFVGDYITQKRKDKGLSIEKLSFLTNINPSVLVSLDTKKILDLSSYDFLKLIIALDINVKEIFSPILIKKDAVKVDGFRYQLEDCLVPQGEEFLQKAGLSSHMICQGIRYVYDLLDKIDYILLEANNSRLSEEVELANLSTIIGNFLGTGIAESSRGIFKRNGPHKYPDLLAYDTSASDVEIKMALETNKPKGHLAKEGYYLTCRYVLADNSGHYKVGIENRGNVAWIWEVRFGYLLASDFNSSNTEGDSGKTATVSSSGMEKLKVIYYKDSLCPYGSRTRRKYQQFLSEEYQQHFLQ